MDTFSSKLSRYRECYYRGFICDPLTWQETPEGHILGKRMMIKCVAQGCTNQSGSGHQWPPLYNFPKCPRQRKKWHDAAKVPIPLNEIRSQHGICGFHFKPGDFRPISCLNETTGVRKSLLNHASVPSIYHVPDLKPSTPPTDPLRIPVKRKSKSKTINRPAKIRTLMSKPVASHSTPRVLGPHLWINMKAGTNTQLVDSSEDTRGSLVLFPFSKIRPVPSAQLTSDKPYSKVKLYFQDQVKVDTNEPESDGGGVSAIKTEPDPEHAVFMVKDLSQINAVLDTHSYCMPPPSPKAFVEIETADPLTVSNIIPSLPSQCVPSVIPRPRSRKQILRPKCTECSQNERLVEELEEEVQEQKRTVKALIAKLDSTQNLNPSSIPILPVLKNNFQGWPLDIVLNEYSNQSTPAADRLFSSKVKELAMKIYEISSSAYRCLSEFFSWPSPGNVSKWILEENERLARKHQALTKRRNRDFSEHLVGLTESDFDDIFINLAMEEVVMVECD